MERGRGCCMSSYRSGGGACDASKYDQIMLRFRPIAPKPVPGDGVSDRPKEDNDGGQVNTGRRKKRYIKDNKNNNSSRSGGGRKKKSCSPEGKLLDVAGAPRNNVVVTLSLLPETPDLTAVTKQEQNAPTYLSLGNLAVKNDIDGQARSTGPVCFGGINRTAVRTLRQRQEEERASTSAIVGSYVIVERVTDTWTAGDGLGRTDDEKRMSLEEDTCPGFISDGWNRVWWTNEAYRKMITTDGVGGGGGDAQTWKSSAEDLAVCLVMRDTPPLVYPAFTCRVRLQNTWRGKETRCTSSSSPPLTLPCDVWRMESGGFAWRLDVKAALCLGR
ncbi:hypothetical protein Nepgr_003022 [Nepenthes gracilis]|uniref:DUF7950 domain-containing protein n=1 Tax=Nepenthes gracilis TaxID=150966 RepID=A0AAD3XCS3_NEPGR|nr:hypothetical protein Nepgr_003022 [Nepenthes gracilis]